jgi:hypothetical protein
MYCGYDSAYPCSGEPQPTESDVSGTLACAKECSNLGGRAPAPIRTTGYTPEEHEKFFAEKPATKVPDAVAEDGIEPGSLVDMVGSFWEITGVYMGADSQSSVVTLLPGVYKGAPPRSSEQLRMPLNIVKQLHVYKKVRK